MSHLRGIVSAIHQPEYTGKNRCIPCTVLNLVIALSVGSGIGLGTSLFVSGQLPIVVSVGSALAFAGVIYLRGYLIPGTPTMTKRYFPNRVLLLFDKHPDTLPFERVGAEQVDVESTLLAAGAITTCEDGDDHCLTSRFRAAWDDHIRAIRNTDGDRRELAWVLSVEETEVTFAKRARELVTYVNGQEAGQWVSRAAFIADMAAARVFSNHYDGWANLDIDQRGQVLSALRIFIETCPACDGRVTFENETIESCCGSVDVIAAVCEECGGRLFDLADP